MKKLAILGMFMALKAFSFSGFDYHLPKTSSKKNISCSQKRDNLDGDLARVKWNHYNSFNKAIVSCANKQKSHKYFKHVDWE